MSELILPSNRGGIIIKELSDEADDLAYFESVIYSRRHLMRFCSETVQNYQTLADVNQSRLDAEQSGKLRFGILDEGLFGGTVNLTPFDDCYEVGYWIDVRHTGKGLATTAVQTVVDFVSRDRRKPYLVGHVDPENIGSQKVLEKSGFVSVRGIGFNPLKYLLYIDN